MVAGANFRTLVLFRPARRLMLPISTQAFQQTQGSRRKLRERCRDALILERDGSVRGIAQIEFKGAFDRMIIPQLLYWLFGVGGIRVVFTEPLSYTLGDVKRLIEDSLQSPATQGDWDLDQPDKLRRFLDRVNKAATFEQLFKALRLPRPDDALDLL